MNELDRMKINRLTTENDQLRTENDILKNEIKLKSDQIGELALDIQYLKLELGEDWE